MGRQSRYVYYQPNRKDLQDKYGDCTIRALSRVLDASWLETFDRMIPFCREAQVANIFGAPIQVRAHLLERLGFKYTGVSIKKGSTRPTVDSFAKTHKTGRYILNVAHHEVAVVDGKYYDTWDSGHKSVYGWFELVQPGQRTEEGLPRKDTEQQGSMPSDAEGNAP